LIAFERITADQFGKSVGLVRLGAEDRAHFMETYIDTALGELESGLGTGQPASNYLDLHCLKCSLLVLVIGVFCVSCARPIDPLPGFPKLVLWAWERPENLSYINPVSTGVAYLAETVTLTPAGIEYHPRMQPLWVPKQTPLIAVVRIESHGSSSLMGVARQIVKAVQGEPIRALQIDFDARGSERSDYTHFLNQLRQALPANIPLEMTALVSWCQTDDWIGRLPVVDAIPMFFRMGADQHSTRESLREPRCRTGIGISTDEIPNFLAPGKRIFVFTNKPWTEDSYRAILQMVKP
jgi:hypothetical protein